VVVPVAERVDVPVAVTDVVEVPVPVRVAVRVDEPVADVVVVPVAERVDVPVAVTDIVEVPVPVRVAVRVDEPVADVVVVPVAVRDAVPVADVVVVPVAVRVEVPVAVTDADAVAVAVTDAVDVALGTSSGHVTSAVPRTLAPKMVAAPPMVPPLGTLVPAPPNRMCTTGLAGEATAAVTAVHTDVPARAATSTGVNARAYTRKSVTAVAVCANASSAPLSWPTTTGLALVTLPRDVVLRSPSRMPSTYTRTTVAPPPAPGRATTRARWCHVSVPSITGLYVYSDTRLLLAPTLAHTLPSRLRPSHQPRSYHPPPFLSAANTG
jgi:hypothetical protein